MGFFIGENMKEKLCTKCGESKPLSEFHKKKDNKDGLRAQCKKCRRIEGIVFRSKQPPPTIRIENYNARKNLFIAGNKKCTKCEEIKNLKNFHKNKNNKDGFVDWCKKCVSVKTTGYNFLNSEKIKKEQEIYYRNNKEKFAAYKKGSKYNGKRYTNGST